MATRQERLLERMRGARMHEVEDVSFGFELPMPEAEPEPSPEAMDVEPTVVSPPPAARPPLNSSAKRTRPGPSPASAATTRSTRSSKISPPQPVSSRSRGAATVYDIDDQSSPERKRTRTSAHKREKSSALSSALKKVSLEVPAEEDEEMDIEEPTPVPASGSPMEVESLSGSLPRRAQRLAIGSARSQLAEGMSLGEEEVEESPADAPGTGRRRPIRISEGAPVIGSSTLLQRVLEDLDESTAHVPSSSPLQSLARRRSQEGALAAERQQRRSGRLSGGSVAGSVADEGSTQSRDVEETEPTPQLSVKKRGRGRPPRASLTEELPAVEEEEPAPESSEKKRGRGRPPRASLAESVPDVEEEEPTPETSGKKRGRGRPPRASLPEERPAEGDQEPTPQPSVKKRGRGRPPRVSLIEELPAVEEEDEESVQIDEAEEPPEEEEADDAQEISDEDAARQLAKRKRPRQSLPAPPSPELHTEADEADPPAAKRRRGRPAASPAQQQQPKAPKSKPAKIQAAPKKRGPKPAPTEEDGEADGGAVPVTVHRFTKKPTVGEDEPDAEILNAEIPFSNRGGVNAVDVLSKLCEELIGAYLAKLEENVRNAEDAATRREQRTMLRSLEAFQEELRTRLLEHTIALDALHALRKRVRVAQKEKLALRDEILRVRAERDQVALRMDAIRIRHEAESKEALRHISLSSAMHDIDLVVEKGQTAEELSATEQKEADLANLELLVNRIADQVGPKSDGGGTLKQIKEFNAFLERTAGVLERR